MRKLCLSIFLSNPGRLLGVMLPLLLLSGCLSVPDVIKGTTATPQQNLLAVQNTPQLYVGQEARFGGQVVSVENEKNRTRLEIVALPLDSGARPLLGHTSIGRVWAYVDKFIDPVDIKNSLVTVVGPISGTENGKIGAAPYTFVVMKVNSYKRWNVSQQVTIPPDPWGWGGGVGYGRGYYGHGFGVGMGYYPQTIRVSTVVTE